MDKQIQRESQKIQQFTQTLYRQIGIQRKPKILSKLISLFEQAKEMQENLINHTRIIQQQEKLSKLQQQNVNYEQGIKICKEKKINLQQRIQKAKERIGGINDKITIQKFQIQFQQNRREIQNQVDGLAEKYEEIKQHEQMIKKTIIKDLDYARKVDAQQITVNSRNLELHIQDLQMKRDQLKQLYHRQTQKKQRIHRDVINFQEQKHMETIKRKSKISRRNRPNEIYQPYPDYQFNYNIHPQEKEVIQQIRRIATPSEQWKRVELYVIMLVILSIVVYILK